MKKTCNKCLIEKDVTEFKKHPETRDKLTGSCRVCMNALQKAHRSKNKYWDCKKYEKTHNGFVMRMYRNMKSRIEGIQKQKAHLYDGKAILSKEQFYKWVLNNPDFLRLFELYKDSGFDRKLAPSVDRVDSKLGYELSNMEIITHSENSRRGAVGRSKGLVQAYKGDELVCTFAGAYECSQELNISISHISYVISGKAKQAKGYTFKRLPL